MTQLIAFSGLSGVGKTTFIRKLSVDADFLHLEASHVIKQQVSGAEEIIPTSEQLRLGNLNHNQILLIRGVQKEVAFHNKLTILDCHTVIDGKNGLENVSVDVFAGLRVSHMLFLEDDAQNIVTRRLADKTRVRPSLSASTVSEHQQLARQHAEYISKSLNVPIDILSHADVLKAKAIITKTI